MFGSEKNNHYRKPLKDANCPTLFIDNVCVPDKADVPKPSWVFMGCVRLKINDLAVVYWQL